MRRRGRRRRLGPSSVSCGPLLFLAFSLFQGLHPVHSLSHKEPNEVKIVGSTNLPVKVYVRLEHNSPRILCVTKHLRNSELIDPIFQWHGPGGDLVAANQTVKITPTGTLMFRHFTYDMSGVYTCSLVFKPTEEEDEKSYLIKYIIYAYSDPNFNYAFTARYHAAPCDSEYNSSFKKKLLQILTKLVTELSCDVTLHKSECHRVKMQRAGLQNELFFKFSVSSLDEEKSKSVCQKSLCDVTRRLKKAKDLIEKFFSQQVQVIGKQTARLPEIYYIEGTLQIVWINRCAQGYGINSQLHPSCSNCCVVCSPGSYNPHEGTHCLPCNKSLAYGAKEC